jgi:probable F420-dependent oxidoreductase
MKLGAVFPTTEIGNDPAVIRDFAQTAEDLGYSHVLIYDHVLGALHADREPPLMGPYTENDAFHEPFVLLAYLAAATTRIELATGVIILPQRQTALVAKQAVELDLLSQGRFRLGVGLGWNFVEYEALGVPYAGRGARIEEQVDVMRRLWREPVVDFDGAHHRIDRAGLLPRPTREIPIWFGGMTRPAVERAARLGDGFTFGSAIPPMLDSARHLLERVGGEGRDPAGFGIETIVHFSQGPKAWCEARDAWEAIGATHLSMRAMDTGISITGEKPAGFTTPGQHIEALKTFADACAS